MSRSPCWMVKPLSTKPSLRPLLGGIVARGRPPPPWCAASLRRAASSAMSARADWRWRLARLCQDCSPRDVVAKACPRPTTAGSARTARGEAAARRVAEATTARSGGGAERCPARRPPPTPGRRAEARRRRPSAAARGRSGRTRWRKVAAHPDAAAAASRGSGAERRAREAPGTRCRYGP